MVVIECDEMLCSGYGLLFDLLWYLFGMNGYLLLVILCGGDLLYLLVGVVVIISLDGMGLCVMLFLVNG